MIQSECEQILFLTLVYFNFRLINKQYKIICDKWDLKDEILVFESIKKSKPCMKTRLKFSKAQRIEFVPVVNL